MFIIIIFTVKKVFLIIAYNNFTKHAAFVFQIKLFTNPYNDGAIKLTKYLVQSIKK